MDAGDHGDTYNYSPPEHDAVVDTPDAVTVTVDERGPVRARPPSPPPTPGPTGWTTPPSRGSGATPSGDHHPRAAGRRAGRPGRHPIRQPVAGPPAPGPPPPPEPAATSRAECAFAVVERGLTPRGGPTSRHPHLPVPPVRVGRRPHRGPRGAARVRAGRPRGERRGRRPGRHAGPHPAAGHRDAVPAGHVPPAAARRSHDAHRGTPDAGSGPRALRPGRGGGRPLPAGRPTCSIPC